MPESHTPVTEREDKPQRRGRQALAAAPQPSDRIVHEPERARITGYSRHAWLALEQQELVPARLKLGPRRVGWLESELAAWLRERAKARKGGGHGATLR